MSKDFLDFKNFEVELQKYTFLPPAFWQAFEFGVYPSSISDKVSVKVKYPK